MDSVAEYREGDRIRATKGDAVMEGVLTADKYSSPGYELAEQGWSLRALQESGWSIEILERAPVYTKADVLALFGEARRSLGVDSAYSTELGAVKTWLEANL